MKPNTQTYKVQVIYWIDTLFVVSLTIKYIVPGGEKSTSEFINIYPGVKKWVFNYLNFHKTPFQLFS